MAAYQKKYLKRCMRKFFLLLFVPVLLYAQQTKESIRLNQLLEEYRKDKSLEHAIYSFCVLNAKTGKAVAEYNSRLSLSPASTLKILTTGAALGMLSPGYRYETRIQYSGSWDSVNGILNGNLIIKGSGDPSLHSQYFRKKDDTLQPTDVWAGILKTKGIKKITGDVIADASAFDDQIPNNWIWADMGNYFGAGACGAVSYNDNKYSLYYKSGNAGEKAEIDNIKPAVSNMSISSEVNAGGSDDNAFIYGAPFQQERKVYGTIPARQQQYEIEGSLPDPALYCAESLLGSCKHLGIVINGKARSSYRNAEKGKTVYTHKSPPLEKIIYYTNLKSDNHYAESLLKTLAQKKNGYGTTSGGCEVVLNYWKDRGVDTDGLFMNDGSGLSRSNGISTSQLAAVLAKIYRDSSIYIPFNASLPVAGLSGSLAGLCKGTFAEKNLRAKSGYITRARGYCGYVKTKRGEELCFSVLFNNYSCSASEVKTKIERLLELLPDL